MQFLSPRTLQAEQLASIVPPAVNPKKGIVIASNAPYWVIGTVALSYAKAAVWVACTQKLGGAIIAMSNEKATAPGTEIDKQIVADVVQKASQAAVPRRGEIWLFDDGYGEHPGLIISPDQRNERSSDVLLEALPQPIFCASIVLRLVAVVLSLGYCFSIGSDNKHTMVYPEKYCAVRLSSRSLLTGRIDHGS